MSTSIRSWVPAGLIAMAMLIAWWLFAVPDSQSEAERQEAVYHYLDKHSASEAELCGQAAEVERAFAYEGRTREAARWTEMKQIMCNSAEICRQLIGGCPPRP